MRKAVVAIWCVLWFFNVYIYGGTCGLLYVCTFFSYTIRVCVCKRRRDHHPPHPHQQTNKPQNPNPKRHRLTYTNEFRQALNKRKKAGDAAVADVDTEVRASFCVWVCW